MDEQEDQNTLTLTLKTNVLPPKNKLIFKLLQDLPLKNEAKVLEIGLSSTEHLSYLLQKAENISYSGTYLNEAAIKEAFSTDEADGNAIELIKKMDHQLDFEDNSFDYCFRHFLYLNIGKSRFFEKCFYFVNLIKCKIELRPG